MAIKLLLLSIYIVIGCTVYSQMTPAYDNILIPMRDGEFLEADVYIPSGTTSGQVILVQTPYNKELFAFSMPLGIGTNLDAQPYIFVIVD